MGWGKGSAMGTWLSSSGWLVLGWFNKAEESTGTPQFKATKLFALGCSPCVRRRWKPLSNIPFSNTTDRWYIFGHEHKSENFCIFPKFACGGHETEWTHHWIYVRVTMVIYVEAKRTIWFKMGWLAIYLKNSDRDGFLCCFANSTHICRQI